MSKRKRAMSLVAAGLICVGTVNATSKTKVDASSITGDAKNVIVMIGDGMSQEAVTLARYMDEDQKLAMDDIASGGVRTYWKNGPITDSAPGGTTFATGQKTDKKNIATSTDGRSLGSVLEASELLGKSTGIVGTSEITHATLADYSAHIDDRSNYTSIIQQQANIGLEVVLGGGMGSNSKFNGLKDENGNQVTPAEFKDKMKSEMAEDGYEIVTTREEMENSETDKIWGLFADAALSIDADREAKTPEEPTLEEMTTKAINTLNKNEEGFFLMVEGSQIDWEAHSNNPVGMMSEILAFDKAVEEAVKFAEEDGNTVVIVTTDHGNSGITIGNKNTDNTYSSLKFEDSVNRFKDAKVSEGYFNSTILPRVKNDEEALRQAVKENFGIENLTDDEIKSIKLTNINKVISDRFGIGFTTGGHTSEDVYLGVYAPAHVNKLKGIVDNTDIAKYVNNLLSGEVSLEALTSDIYQVGKDVFLPENKNQTLNIEIKEFYRPKAIITKTNKNGKVVKLELDLNTNDYVLNGKEGSLKTVMPYIKGNFFVPQELVDTFNEAKFVNPEKLEKGGNN